MMSDASQSFAPSSMLTARDATGRELVIRELTALDRLRLFKAVGPTLSQNTAYLGMALLAMSVTAIDNVPVPAPATEAQVEAAIAKLGDAGLAAVADAMTDDNKRDLDKQFVGN